jgi:hypothetical protein
MKFKKIKTDIAHVTFANSISIYIDGGIYSSNPNLILGIISRHHNIEGKVTGNVYCKDKGLIETVYEDICNIIYSQSHKTLFDKPYHHTRLKINSLFESFNITGNSILEISIASTEHIGLIHKNIFWMTITEVKPASSVLVISNKIKFKNKKFSHAMNYGFIYFIKRLIFTLFEPHDYWYMLFSEAIGTGPNIVKPRLYRRNKKNNTYSKIENIGYMAMDQNNEYFGALSPVKSSRKIGKTTKEFKPESRVSMFELTITNMNRKYSTYIDTNHFQIRNSDKDNNGKWFGYDNICELYFEKALPDMLARKKEIEAAIKKE